MTLSYAGTPLLLDNPTAAAWVEQHLTLRDCLQWVRRQWPGPGLAWLDYQPLPWDGAVEIGNLRWPRGAARWSLFHGLAGTEEVKAIRQKAYAGNVYRACDLILDDGNHKITAPMWLLPPRPLAKIDGQEGLHLLTLVDDRFWWWQRTGVLEVTPGETAWEDLYAQLETLLDITLAVDIIPSAYLNPSASFTSIFQPLPLLLDAVSDAVQQKLVRSLDGTCRMQNVLAARALCRTNLNDATRAKQAGGKFSLEPAPGDHVDLPPLLPESVVLIFATVDTNYVPSADAYSVQVAFASLGLDDLAGVPVNTGAVKVFRSTATALGVDPSNATVLGDLATQLATDWYRWQASWLDIAYVGIEPWVLDGLSDTVQWIYREGQCYTRIQRGPWHEGADWLAHDDGSGFGGFGIPIYGPLLIGGPVGISTTDLSTVYVVIQDGTTPGGGGRIVTVDDPYTGYGILTLNSSGPTNTTSVTVTVNDPATNITIIDIYNYTEHRHYSITVTDTTTGNKSLVIYNVGEPSGKIVDVDDPNNTTDDDNPRNVISVTDHDVTVRNPFRVTIEDNDYFLVGKDQIRTTSEDFLVGPPSPPTDPNAFNAPPAGDRFAITITNITNYLPSRFPCGITVQNGDPNPRGDGNNDPNGVAAVRIEMNPLGGPGPRAPNALEVYDRNGNLVASLDGAGNLIATNYTSTLSNALASTQAAHRVYAGPTSGADALAAFRAFVNTDLPSTNVNATKTVVTAASCNAGTLTVVTEQWTFVNGALSAVA